MSWRCRDEAHDACQCVVRSVHVHGFAVVVVVVAAMKILNKCC